MLNNAYYWFHRLISQPQERGAYSGGYLQDKVRNKAVALCKSISAGRVIEVGCGEGLFLRSLSAQNKNIEIWGVDNNASRLKKAEDKCRDVNLKNINLSLQEAGNLSFENNFFDAAICINVFFNMDSITSVINALYEMRRVCRKSGRIIFDFRNSTNPLLLLKYKLAPYYDSTVKNLPLKTYFPTQIERILKGLDLQIVSKIFIPPLFERGAGPFGFILESLAPIILIEARGRC